MKNSKLLILSLLVFTSCAPKGFQSAAQLGSTNPSGNQDLSSPDNGSDSPVTNNPLDNVDLKGHVESNDSTYKNALAFDFDKVRGEFIIMLPMPSGVLFTPTGSFSKYPDISFSPIIDATGRLKFAVRIPIKYIIRGVNLLPAASLPNGDPLPAMPQGYGELPSLALNFPQHNNTQISLYMGVNAVGLYVTLPPKAALPFGFTLPVKNADKTKTFGYLSYVPAKGTYPPGLFVSTIIPANMSRILEDYFHL